MLYIILNYIIKLNCCIIYENNKKKSVGLSKIISKTKLSCDINALRVVLKLKKKNEYLKLINKLLGK